MSTLCASTSSSLQAILVLLVVKRRVPSGRKMPKKPSRIVTIVDGPTTQDGRMMLGLQTTVGHPTTGDALMT
jgi:hypothetical protein